MRAAAQRAFHGPAPDLIPLPPAAERFPRLRYMGSKFALLDPLRTVFRQVGGTTALDAFSGSGVVSYLLKTLGYAVTSNDFLWFPSIIARATTENPSARLDADAVERICGPAADDRRFIRDTFSGTFFTPEDLGFLDAAWSHIARMRGYKRDLAIAALVLSAARKQPRGVFTVTGQRYDDGRRDLHLPLRDHFREHAATYSAVVFDSGRACRAQHGDVLAMEAGAFDVVYMDPPYAPPKDDNCYMKRYHFLEGLSVYWEGQQILHETKTRKIAKPYTPFSYKHTIGDALGTCFRKFADSTLVLSYSSNAVPDAKTLEQLLRRTKRHVDVVSLDHTYSFGTHASAQRRSVSEYLFVAT